MSYDDNEQNHTPEAEPGVVDDIDDGRRSGTNLSVRVPLTDQRDSEESYDEEGSGDEDGDLSDSEMRRREEAGLNSPTGAQARDSQQNASYAAAVGNEEGGGADRDERGPRSPRRISKQAQVSWTTDEQKNQAGDAVTQADEPPAALAAMLTQVDKGNDNPITSVPRDDYRQPGAATSTDDQTDTQIRTQMSQQSQQRGSWLSCCAWLNCASQVEEVPENEEPTIISGASGGPDIVDNTRMAAGGGERSGVARGISDICDGGFEPSVDYPDPYYEDGLLPRPFEQHKRQKCLVLDLDETLVHSSFKPVPNADFIIPVEIDGVIHRVYVMKRPYVDEFLRRCARKYEVVVFTASLAKYANPLLDQLDPDGTVTHRLFRESCVIHQTAYVKDLTRLARPISKTIIVDNSAQSYLFQPKNAIPIPSWFDDMSDTMLLDLLPVCETTMWEIPDVRKLLDAHTKSYRWLCNQANKTPEFS